MAYSLRRWLIFAGMALAYAASILDTTIMHLALPTIARWFATDLMTASWVVNSYNLVFCAFLVTAGRLADTYGHKRLLLIGISLFSLASLACALAPSLFWLIVFRGIEALGCACLGSVGLSVVGLLFPKECRSRPLGIWSAIAALAAILGPIVGGLALLFSWRLLFLINLPICALAFLLTNLLPTTPTQSRAPRFDVAGMFFVALLLTSIILLLIETWSLPQLVILLLVATLSLAGLILAERSSAAPLVDAALFRVQSFAASSLGMLLFWLAYQGASLILGLYLLGAAHLSAEYSPSLKEDENEIVLMATLALAEATWKPFEFQPFSMTRCTEQAALFSIPVPIANVIVSLLVRGTFPQWVRAVAGILCGACGFLWLSVFGTAPLWILIFPALLIGGAASLCFTSFHACVLSDISPPHLGQASGLFNTCRQLATTAGAALLLGSISWHLQGQVTLLKRYAQATMQVAPMTSAQRIQASTRCDTWLASLVANQGSAHLPQIRLLGVPSFDTWFSGQVQAAIVTAFSQTWMLCAALAVLALPLALALRPRRTPTRALSKVPHPRIGGIAHAVSTRS
jgi:MFS family permease